MKPITISNSTANDVLDLLGGIDLNTSNNTQQQPIISSANSIFGNTLNESQTNNLFDGFLNDGTPNQQNSIPPIVAFDKNGLKLEFSFEKPSDNPILTIISLTAINSTSSPMLEFLFQAAVPKV
jgi:AP-1 complex subunit gamma-1